MHIPRYLGRSEMKMYVNTEFMARASLGYPTYSAPMQSSSIGSNSTISFFRIGEQHTFYGQICSTCLIDGAITDKKMTHLYAMDQDKPLDLLNMIDKSTIIWAYHPMAVEKNIAYDLSGMCHGILLGSIKTIITLNVKEAFYCSRGVKGMID